MAFRIRSHSCLIYILLLWGLTVECVGAHAQAISPDVVGLETTLTIKGMSNVGPSLLIRVTRSGKVEWDEYSANVPVRKTANVSTDQVAEILKRLAPLDQQAFQPRMGPFNMNLDTTSEVHIQFLSTASVVTFTLINPWPSIKKLKPLPKSSKVVLCEAVRLRHQVSGDHYDKFCDDGNEK